jgi:hypothetical protein
MVTEWGSGRTRLEILESKVGLSRVRRVTRVSLADGLQAGRKTINEAIFHEGDIYSLDAEERERAERMALGLSGLQSYRREYDDELKRFRDNPLKDWAEHIGSAFRYLGLSWREPWTPPAEKKKPQPAPGQVYIPGVPEANTSNKRTRL